MKKLSLLAISVSLISTHAVKADQRTTLSLYVGYLTQIHCRGRLFLSSVGNPHLIHWEAFPKEMGCGVVLQPKGLLGSTDLLIKTSTGDFHFILDVKKPSPAITTEHLEYQAEPQVLKGKTE